MQISSFPIILNDILPGYPHIFLLYVKIKLKHIVCSIWSSALSLSALGSLQSLFAITRDLTFLLVTLSKGLVFDVVSL